MDFIGFIVMFTYPNLTPRVIPALAGVQIFGFIAMAILVVTTRRDYISPEPGRSVSAATGNEWVPWLFGFLAMVSFLRVILAIFYIAADTGKRHSWFSPVAGALMGCFFLWLALKTVRSTSDKGGKGDSPKIS